MDDNPPGNTQDIVGYGKYKITIDGNSFTVDYRDYDYSGEKTGVYGCHSVDLGADYDPSNGTFSVASSDPPFPNIWDKKV